MLAEHLQQVVDREHHQERDKADAHGLRINAHCPDRTDPGKAKAHHRQGQRMSQFDAIALVITPQRQHHVRHYHDQRRALGDLLIETKPDAEQRDSDQAAADAEYATESAKGGAEQQVQHKLHHSQFLLRQVTHPTQSRLAGKRIATHNGYADFAQAFSRYEP
ncbi:hypothetical protein EMIT0P395_60097 [Pseudomonas sp. IT-P395]